jgi:diguanylate cyclase (GGDEF)-like protein
MGLDSNLTAAGAPIGASKPSEAREGAAVARATTASMQNLLAQYFAAQEAAQAQSDSASSSPVHDHQAVIAAAMEPGLAANDSTPAEAPHLHDEEASWPEAARAAISALRTELARLRAGMERQAVLLQSARTQADGDVLTPTLNRRAFLREVQRAMADCRRYGEEAALIYIDMDGFKGINDRHGHAAGDSALIHVAEILNANVREGDSVGRLGGDEFAVLLRHADLKSARVKALKLESELASTDFEHEGFSLKTGASFGVRAWAGQASAEAWLSEADAAMFLVKKSSR